MANKLNATLIKIVIQILERYSSTNKKDSPAEYIKNVMATEDLCLDEESEFCTELLLDICRHQQFLELVLSKIFPTDSDQCFMVILYLICFKINEETYKDTYAVMTEQSQKKSLILLRFLTNSNCFCYITKIACAIYDIDFVQHNIVANFKTNIHLMKEMLKKSEEFYQVMKLKNMRPLTVPVEPDVMKHPTKKTPATPPQAQESFLRKFCTTKIPDTTYKMDEDTQKLLDKCHEKNKQNALKLWEEAQAQAFNCAKPLEPENYDEAMAFVTEQNVTVKRKHMPSSVSSPVPVKTNLATLLRVGARINKQEQDEIKRIEAMETGSFDSSQIVNLEAEIKRQNQEERLLDIKRKHIQGLLTYEESVLAKQNLLQLNKEKMIEFKKEKEELEKKLEEWKAAEEEKIKILVEKSQNYDKGAKEAKENLCEKNQKLAKEFKEESRVILEEAMKQRQEELANKMALIKEIKALQNVKDLNVKEFDDTTTLGLGLMCEMSLAELRERLLILRIELQEELERRQKAVKEQKAHQQKLLADAQATIERHRNTPSRPKLGKLKPSNVADTEDIINLQKMLEEKREKRKQMYMAANYAT